MYKPEIQSALDVSNISSPDALIDGIGKFKDSKFNDSVPITIRYNSEE
jgi:hypothetical protein